MRKISDSTVRRLSVYLRFLEQAKSPTISSGELARLAGTTSAQVRKDLSFFGSFGKRGLGYAVPELARRIRDIRSGRAQNRVALEWLGRERRPPSRNRSQERSERHRHCRDARRVGAARRRSAGAQRSESHSQFCAGATE